MSRHWNSAKAILPLAVACLISFIICNWSKHIATYNPGDYSLALHSLLEKQPLDVASYSGVQAAFVWPFASLNVKPWNQRNASWLYLWAHTKLQRLFSRHFSLALMPFCPSYLPWFVAIGLLSCALKAIRHSIYLCLFCLPEPSRWRTTSHF